MALSSTSSLSPPPPLSSSSSSLASTSTSVAPAVAAHATNSNSNANSKRAVTTVSSLPMTRRKSDPRIQRTSSPSSAPSLLAHHHHLRHPHPSPHHSTRHERGTSIDATPQGEAQTEYDEHSPHQLDDWGGSISSNYHRHPRPSTTSTPSTPSGGGVDGGSSSLVTSAASPHSALALIALVLYLLFSTLSTRLLPQVVIDRFEAPYLIPTVHFLMLSLFASAHGRLRPHHSPFANPWRKWLVSCNASRDDPRHMWIMRALGLTSNLSLVLKTYAASQLDERIVAALEIQVIPIIIAFLLWSRMAPFFPSSTRTGIAHPTLITISIASAFLVAFALIGAPADGLGLVFSITRLPVEAARLLLLREAVLDQAHLGETFIGAMVVAGSTSLWVGIVPIALEFSEVRSTWTSATTASFLLYSLWLLLAELCLFASLAYFSSVLYPALALIPRNLILLVVGTFGRYAMPLRGSWSQMAVVLAGGTLGTAFVDPDTFASWPSLGSRIPFVKHQSRGTYSHLPSSSIDLSSLGSPIPSTPRRRSSSGSPQPPSSSISLRVALLPLLPLLWYLFQHPSTAVRLETACRILPPSARATLCGGLVAGELKSRSVDLVISYYDEPLDTTKEHLDAILMIPFIAQRDNKVLIYNKGGRAEPELRSELGLRAKDEVIALPNLGREGETYLQHILRHYNATVSLIEFELNAGVPRHVSPSVAHRVLADHTFFLQPHLAWADIARPRINLVASDTGFAHFGPLLRSDCGLDGRGNGEYPYVGQFYNIFIGEICPPTGQLTAWSAQFAVSRRRIMANPYARYAHVASLLEQPTGHWIHDMWGANGSGGPSNPALGHHLERSWPFVFGCKDPTIADRCPDEVHVKELCQCLDS